MFPVGRRDGRLRNKARVVGLKIGPITRAYPLAELSKLPGRQLRQEFDGGELVLRAGQADDEVSILTAPSGARIIHTFWFAWAATHPNTELWLHQPQPADTTSDG